MDNLAITIHFKWTIKNGQAFYVTSRRALHDIDDAVLAVSDEMTAPRGTLRVTAPVDYGTAVITPLLISLRQRYPALKVDLLCADSRIDLIAEVRVFIDAVRASRDE